MGDVAGYPNPEKSAIFFFFFFLFPFLFESLGISTEYQSSICQSVSPCIGRRIMHPYPDAEDNGVEGECPESRPCQLKNALAANNLIWCVCPLSVSSDPVSGCISGSVPDLVVSSCPSVPVQSSLGLWRERHPRTQSTD